MRSRSASVGLAVRMLGLLLLTTCTENVPTSPPSSRTPQSPAPPPVMQPVGPAGAAALLIGAGEIARCDRTNDEATGLLLDNYPGATVFTAGNNTNGNASLTDFNNCYGPSWGRNKARTRPAVGNNDYKQPGAAGYFQYFGTAAGDSAKYYYSYNLGAWHIMVLNDQIAMTVGSPQELWLRAELAANTSECTIAIWHHPRFSSTGTNNLASVKPLWDALYAYNADVVVNATVTWGSSDTTVAKVNSSGLVTGKTSGGPITITATSDTKSATAAITVTTVPVGSVDVTPASATVSVNALVQLTVAVKDTNGN